MSENHSLQAQRFEVKYLIPAALTVPIRNFVRAYLDIDEFGEGVAGYAYPVHSIYLDSDDLKTYQWSQNGDKNRFKLRVRYYDSSDNGPIFFETKRRVNDCILKERCGLHRRAAAQLLAGYIPDVTDRLSSAPSQLASLERFAQLMLNLGARPKAHVAYDREAWVSPHDNSVRVTMDSNIRCEPRFELRLSTEMDKPFYVFGRDIILELKFTDRMPNWFQELVRAFNLTRTGGAKYAWGLEQLGTARFTPHSSSLDRGAVGFGDSPANWSLM